MFRTTTNTYLLAGLKDPANEAVWREYVDRYRPLIVAYALKVGFRHDDAQDIAQDTLMEFSRAYRAGKYQRERGRLRSWLFGIAHNQIRNAGRRRRAREVQVADSGDGTGFFARIESRDELENLWEAEWRDAVLRACLEEARTDFEPKTVEAFRLFTLGERSAEEVAKELAMTPNAVFLAKHRVLRRIRELVPQMEEVW